MRRSAKKEPITKKEALLTMADLCARSEQCEADIYQKLRRRGLSHPECQEVIDDLIERGFIDHLRFARAFARDKVRFSAWGRMKIRLALAAKKIPSAVVEEALKAIEPDDYEDAVRRAAASKVSSIDLNDYEDRMRLFRFMISRGFEASVSGREIDRLKELRNE